MRQFRFACAAVALAFTSLLPATSGAANDGQDIQLLFKGFSVPNTRAQPVTQAFAEWCNNSCAPSVQIPVYDPANGRLRGNIYVWTTPFVPAADFKSFCFNEFIEFELKEGTLYTQSNPNGVCGATIDPSLKPATHVVGGAVVAGGGDGVIVGGSRKYRNATGTYTDRVFVELGAPGSPYYYDQLWFSLSPQ
jgi:hypothetical protein